MSKKDLDFNDKLIAIQKELKAPKNQRNNFGKYNYRSCEDILEAVKPLLSKYALALTISDEIKELGGILFAEATVTLGDMDAKVSVQAQAGIDPNRKGMDIAQSFGSSSSYARKYALNGMFLIDDTKDADATNTHGKGAKSAEPTKWLNEGTPEFPKAQKWLKDGGDIETLRTKYKISKKVAEALLK